MIDTRRLILAATILLALPAFEGSALEIRYRKIGDDWKSVSSSSGKVQAGKPGSGVALDGLAIEIPGVKAEIFPFVEGKTYKRWTIAAQPSGVAGKKLEGFRLKVDKGTVRYRGSFLGVGLSEWAEDGNPLGESDAGLVLESVEVEYTAPTTELPSVEYRAAFGKELSPWTAVGFPLKGSGAGSPLTALSVRSGGDVRCEVWVTGKGWTPPAVNGEVAGIPGGPLVQSIRIYSPKVPIAYRVKVRGRGWSDWCYTGEECAIPGTGLPIEEIVVAREAAKP